MKASYQVISRRDSRQLAEFLAKDGQLLLPMLDLITEAEAAIDEVIDVMGRAAYRLDWKEGIKRLETQARWLETDYPSAAASLREGLEETFTINRLGLPGALRRGLATTNIIESPHAGVRQRTRRVSRWRDVTMVLRWTATALV